MMGDKGSTQMTDAVDEPTQKLATNDIPGSSQNKLHDGLQACGSDNDSSCADKTPDSEPPTQSIFTDTAPTGTLKCIGSISYKGKNKLNSFL